ncbi:TIGR04197 family type VII secretion effector [Lachnospiraceae bacterium OttesenSCG-928-E19]|nr:TIGR04197 family type VII secretion effector [Lachnospiraceae bacterium OttesenSCG-928-E19]
MDDDLLVINYGTMDGEATKISSAKQFLQTSSLSPIDDETTIEANKRGQETFSKAQDEMETLGGAIDQEVVNIRSLGLAFLEFDNMMAEANRTQE